MRGRAGVRAAGSNENGPTETRAVPFAESRSEQPRIQTLESSVITLGRAILGRAILETLMQTLEFSVTTHRKQNEKCSAATGAEECNEKSSAVLRRAVLRRADPQRKESKQPERKRTIKKNTCRQGRKTIQPRPAQAPSSRSHGQREEQYSASPNQQSVGRPSGEETLLTPWVGLLSKPMHAGPCWRACSGKQ